MANIPYTLDVLLERAIKKLFELLGDRISVEEVDRFRHSSDASWYKPVLPDAVCYPVNNEEIAAILNICNFYKTPVIPYGSGSSIEGQTLPVKGGIIIDHSRMNKILDIRTIDQDCTVQAGISKKLLNEQLKPLGLFFPCGPESNSTIGGLIANNSNGSNVIKYGTIKDHVKSITMVTPMGDIIRTRQRVLQSAAGYDLTQLMIGSEGTLGIITEVTLKLHPVPESTTLFMISFHSVSDAVKAGIEIQQKKLPAIMLEFMDELVMGAINLYDKTNYPVQPTLVVELHSGKDHDEAHALLQIVRKYNYRLMLKAHSEEEKQQMLQYRHHAIQALRMLRPGCRMWTTDVCLPISKLVNCLVETKKELEQSLTPIPLFGHIGQGCFNVALLFDPHSPKDMENIQHINKNIIVRALKMGGTCSGSNGIGISKRKFLEMEFGANGIFLMQTIKAAIDPNGIMNPGKVL